MIYKDLNVLFFNQYFINLLELTKIELQKIGVAPGHIIKINK